MNIPSAILQLVGGNATNSISSLLGLSQDQTKRATTAAVPSLLAGLTGLASTPQGAERLADTVSRQDSGVVDNLTGALSGQGARLAEQGSGLLGSLLGQGATSKLGGVLSRFTGVGEGGTSQLLGLLIPVILGFLGKQQRSMGLNASGLASLLGGQKDNIRAAMPAGLETALSSAIPGVSQLFGSGGARIATEQPRHTYEETAPRAEETADWKSRGAYGEPAHREGGGKKWVVPLLLGLAALVAFMLWSNRNPSRRNAPQSVGAPGAPSEIVTGKASSFVSDTSKLIGQASTTLAGVKDSASAEAAVPRLEQINQQMSGLLSTWNQLPESAKSTARSSLQPQIARLQQATQPLLSQPGIGDIVRPQVEDLMQKLNAFSSR